MKSQVIRKKSAGHGKLLDAIGNRSARIGVLGLGYVGLPLACLFAEKGFAVTGFTRRRLPLKFEDWVKRMRTPDVQVAAIRALHRAVSEEVRRHFEIAENGDFVIDQAVIEMAPL